MDVGFDYGGGCRNGLESSYFGFLGIGEGTRKVGKWRSAQAKELADNNPYANNVSDQSALVQKHDRILEGLRGERAKAKSKKTKNSLDARIQAYEEWLADAKYHLSQLEKEASSPVTLTSGGTEYKVEPAPIVTSQGGEVVLPKKQEYVQEQPAQTQTDLVLGQATEPQAKKDYSLLYVGIGVVALFLILRNK